MACFVVPAAEAAIVTIATHVLEKMAIQKESKELSVEKVDFAPKEPLYKKLKLLSNLLWGGSALLAFEHLWHGEIQPWYPFLTAAQDAAETQVMLHEMATVGVSMAALVTTVWAGIIAFKSVMAKRAALQPLPIEEKKEN